MSLHGMAVGEATRLRVVCTECSPHLLLESGDHCHLISDYYNIAATDDDDAVDGRK